ncbi:nucleotide sugar dehydrogenase [Brevibacillus fulvus]|uniref:UDP-glucose 6-dehydrogenase n=1 Tax=Brevibacillus fulvus TaxID=1125967 RepID=A0A938XVV3_9BACL|nr:nucleotide sugar dehydrogenase [Brevibacillus fulvus]MBM7588896.1 nucleotide sugar dehydrogenase [Brevibacillus fulvus]
MHIWMIGSGYVGLTTGCMFAYLGHQVTLLDTDAEKIARLQAGEIPFHEKGLPEVFAAARKNMAFTCRWDDFSTGADVVMVAVGTPSRESGDVDLSYVHTVAREIGRRLIARHLPILLKSTVPIGTAKEVQAIIQQELDNREWPGSITVIANPEFLREGEALQDAFYPDRLIVGTDDGQCLSTVHQLYQPLLEQRFHPPAGVFRPVGYAAPALLVTNSATAEMIKYASNAFLAMKISFINEFANLADKVGADIIDVAKGIGLDKRIGPHFLQAGIGWGGSCFGKDTKAIVQLGKQHATPMQLIEATLAVNQQQRQKVLHLLMDELSDLHGRTIGILGLAFKPNTDDLRDAPALELIEQLAKYGARVKVFDPVAMETCQKLFPTLDVNYCDNVDALFDGTDAVILVTEWEQFRDLPFSRLGQYMTEKRVIDTRNFWDPARLRNAGFSYRGIGRGQLPRKERVLVTGGAGFIGSHLVDQLLAEGFDVHVIDMFDDFYEIAQKEKNIQHHLHSRHYSLSRVDICQRDKLEDIFAAWQPEIVIHLAARAGVRPSVQNAAAYVETNVTGTLHLLDLAAKYKVKRFIFGSSSSVYGLNDKVPFCEEDPLLSVASPYAATKIAGESLCQSYSNCYGLDVIVLRFFTVYGPRQRPDLAIHTFVHKMMNDQPIQLYGDGTTSRDYTFVSDIVSGIRRAMEAELSGYHVFNLGNDQPTKLIELVNALEWAIGKKAKIEWLPLQVGDVPATWADLQKSRQVLKYQPTVTLEQGLSNYLDWVQSQAKG